MKMVVDVGGTNTRVAASRDGKTFENKVRFSTPQDFDAGIDSVVSKIRKIVGKRTVKNVVIGIPGTIDRRTGKPVRVPHIPSWEGKDVAYEVQTKLGSLPAIANDAELAALGEAVFGAGKAYRLVAYLTVGTGVGGALVVDQKLVPRAYNSEPGHMIKALQTFDSDEIDFESFASGKAFEKRFGVSPEESNDPQQWKAHAQILGRGIVSILLLWSPEILVIGGGLAKKGELLFTPLREVVNTHLSDFFPPPPIVPAGLGDDSGLYGGLVLLK